MTILHAIILGLIEGLTEFIPVSSTAHLIITSKLMGLESTDFLKAFEYIVQGGAILSLFFVFTKQLLTKPILIIKLFVAFLPTAIVGLLLKKLLFDHLLDETYLTLFTLVAIGLFMVFWDKFSFLNQSKFTDLESVPYTTLIIIGLIQSIAIVPGVSRSAASIFAGLALGMDKPTAIKWSFLLALPTLLGATAISLLDTPIQLLMANLNLIIAGTLTAALTGALVLILVQKFARELSWKTYGIYRVLFALTSTLILFTK